MRWRAQSSSSAASSMGSRLQDGGRHPHFAAGDQIVFLKNEGSLGVKNGMLAKVVEAASGRLVAEIGEGEHRRQVIGRAALL
jgi:ATP-dependent exoDNAse (exonuclease V) alpha subunit